MGRAPAGDVSAVPQTPPAGPWRTAGVVIGAVTWAFLAGPGMRAGGGAGIIIPAEAGQGAAAPYQPPRERHPALLCWAAWCVGGLTAAPPRPPRVRAGQAVVLSEAQGCGCGAGPGVRAVGGAGIIIPAEAGQGAAAPYQPPLKR